MSRRPFDADELDQPAASTDRAITELERYSMDSDAAAPGGLSERVMAAVEHEPAPRRGFIAWLTTPSATGDGPRRAVRVAAVAATLILAVAGALFAGQLASLVRDVGGDATPTPSVSPPSSGTPSASMGPSLSIEPTPAATPEGSDDHGGSGASPTAQPTPQQTPNGIPQDTPEESKTPRPSATTTASPSPAPAPNP